MVSDEEYKANNHILVSGNETNYYFIDYLEYKRYLSSTSLRKDSYVQIATEGDSLSITFTNGHYLLTIFIIITFITELLQTRRERPFRTQEK